MDSMGGAHIDVDVNAVTGYISILHLVPFTPRCVHFASILHLGPATPRCLCYVSILHLDIFSARYVCYFSMLWLGPVTPRCLHYAQHTNRVSTHCKSNQLLYFVSCTEV